MLSHNEVSVRKPEQNTIPNLFYIEGESVNLVPTATEREPAGMVWSEVMPIHGGSLPDGPIHVENIRQAEQMVQVAYNAQHKVPWHWQVPAYMVTKSIGAGLWLLLALGLFLPLGISDDRMVGAGLLGIGFIGLTTALLVLDLERPERFLRILTHPQWRSWLTRGAFILIGFTAVICAWWASLYFGGRSDVIDGVFAVLTIPLAIGSAIYTAFLFGQAEGRDLWQSRVLAPHLFVQAVLAGAAALLILDLAMGASALNAHVGTVFLGAVLIDLALCVLDILILPHETQTARAAVHAIRWGRYKVHFWVGGLVMGHIVPLTLLWSGPFSAAVAGLSALIGLYLYEHAYVYAPQDVPNS